VSLVPVTVHIWCMSRSCNSSGPKPSLKGPHNLSPLLTISISLQCDWPKSCRKKAVPISNHSPSCLIETPTSYVLIHHMLTFRDISQNANQRSGTFCRMRLERFSSPSMQPNWPGSLWPSIRSIPAPVELLGPELLVFCIRKPTIVESPFSGYWRATPTYMLRVTYCRMEDWRSNRVSHESQLHSKRPFFTHDQA
jgi:hypothetical protein